MPTRRVVLVTPNVPFADVSHAGGRYLLALVRHLESGHELTVVAPSSPAARDAVGRAGAPASTLLVGGVPGGTVTARARGRLVALGERHGRRFDPGMPSLSLVDDLLLGGPAADLVRAADVVDLQWSECIRLAGLVRRVAPAARLVGTFHDVQSQLFAREPSRGAVGRAGWALASRRARHLERRDVGRLDATIVFSAKDAVLLGSPDTVRVVHPPLAPDPPPVHTEPTGVPTVLLVAHLARPENDDAVRWLLAQVWPAVRSRVPTARLRVVGAGASEALTSAAAATPGVEVAGFVPDLAPEYAAAWCCVVPLRTGAGVKFKTVEALVHGVPVVTTPVGAEGIGDPGWYATVSDSAPALAAGLVDALRDPASATARAREVQTLAVRDYGRAAFETAITAAYDG